MTPEKLILLREWMQSEIDYKIKEANSNGAEKVLMNKGEVDLMFYKVVQAFCGTD